MGREMEKKEGTDFWKVRADKAEMRLFAQDVLYKEHAKRDSVYERLFFWQSYQAGHVMGATIEDRGLHKFDYKTIYSKDSIWWVDAQRKARE